MAKREIKTKKDEVVEEVVAEETTVVSEELPSPKVEGSVTDCIKLNVRNKPSIKSKVLKELTAKTKVTIDESASTEEWYKITVDGIEGYCMKKYIQLI